MIPKGQTARSSKVRVKSGKDPQVFCLMRFGSDFCGLNESDSNLPMLYAGFDCCGSFVLLKGLAKNNQKSYCVSPSGSPIVLCAFLF